VPLVSLWKVLDNDSEGTAAADAQLHCRGRRGECVSPAFENTNARVIITCSFGCNAMVLLFIADNSKTSAREAKLKKEEEKNKTPGTLNAVRVNLMN